MTKKDLLAKLEKIATDIESALDDESLRTVGKKIDKINDDLGSLIQEIEDESDE